MPEARQPTPMFAPAGQVRASTAGSAVQRRCHPGPARLDPGAPGKRAAAALLFEGLLRPGFDPAMGAAAARRYVSRKATIAILNHRKASDGSVRPWEALGVSERRYYKLLQRFAPKIGARYQVDEGVLEQIRTHLASRDQEADKHAAAMDLLQERGFSYAAARKWLQRHDLSEAVTAMPRCRQPPARPAF
jgi:hypothetical protein